MLKTLQTNLNSILKKYENLSVDEVSQNEINNEIKQLEEENIQLNKKIQSAIEATNNSLVFKEASVEFSQQKETTEAAFSPDFATFTPDQFAEDPFKAFDPFKDTSNPAADPFKDNNGSDPFKDSSNDPFKDAGIDSEDPFSSPNVNQKEATDPFASDPFGAAKTQGFAGEGFEDDPFTNVSLYVLVYSWIFILGMITRAFCAVVSLNLNPKNFKSP